MLKLARESCIATRGAGSVDPELGSDKNQKDGLGRLEEGSRFSRFPGLKTVKINENCSVMNLNTNILTDSKVKAEPVFMALI